MLPSLRDELRIALCPDRVIMTRVAGRWRPRVTAKRIERCAGQGAGSWKACVETLREMLADGAAKNVTATVIISNHFVRYALVPWSEALASDEEKLVWVRHHFVEIYGEAVAGAEYRWSEDRPDAPCLASAIDGEFVQAIGAAFSAASLRVRSIQPYFMAAFNRCARRVNGGALWMLNVEPGRICLASIVSGKWRGMASKLIGADWRAELPMILGRELLLAESDAAPKTVFAYAPEVPNFEIPGWKDAPVRALAARALPGFSPHTDAEYAMALTGVA